MTNAELFEGLPVNQGGSEASPAVDPLVTSVPSPAASVDEAAATIRQL
jgi:hypothetical protein